jgi:hypothetical protein
MNLEKAVYPAYKQKMIKEIEGVSIRNIFPPSAPLKQLISPSEDSYHWIVTKQGNLTNFLF